MKKNMTYIWMKVTLCVMGLFCLAILIQTVRLKVFEVDNYREKLNKIQNQKVRVEPRRGDILARDGRKLACSVPSYKICMDPCAAGLPDSVFNKNIWKLATQLSLLFRDKTPEEYRAKIEHARKEGKQYIVLGNRRVSHSELKRVKEFAIFNRGRNRGGFMVEQSDERKKPFGIMASRTIGKLYEDKEMGGMVGLEHCYNKELSGRDGISNRIKVGKWIEEEVTPPQDGRSLLTTIDIDVQDVAEQSMIRQLREHNADHGVAILMEVRTGAVRAIVNLHRNGNGTYTEDHYNYAIGELAEPGSTFKLATLMALLEDDMVSMEDSIETYGGEYKFHDAVMRDSKPHGTITVQQAFELSSNIAFSRMAVNAYGDDERGYNHFVSHLKDLGLCDSLELDIKGEKRTYFKDPADTASKWSRVTLPWMSIGYETKITPLQLLTFYNTVANNGTMMRPMFVEAQIENGRKVSENQPHVIRNSIASRKTIRAVQSALKGVVEHGTAQNIRNTPYKIAGKTGTAQIAKGNKGYGKEGERSYLASFAGYFPADEPLYSCVVMVYGPSNSVYYGNKVAGEVVKAIADRVYAAEFRKGVGNVKPQIPTSGTMPQSKGGWANDLMRAFGELKIPTKVQTSGSDWVSARATEEGVTVKARHYLTNVMPDVKGMGASDAVSLLESMGLRVNIVGVGAVADQSVPKDTRVAKGSSVTIYLRN